MPNTVRITGGWNQRATSFGSSERILDRSPDGTLWVHLTGAQDDVQLWYSKNQGTTWRYAGDRSKIGGILVMQPHAFHIDSEGYGHSLTRISNTKLRYARGTPARSGTSWNWEILDFAPSTEALQPESGFSIVGFKSGEGWKVWILAGTTLRAAGETTTLRLSRIDVSKSGGLSVGGHTVLRTESGDAFPYGTVSFDHTGDGKTPTATPHLYVVSSVNKKNISNTRHPVNLQKLTYEAGNWTLGSTVTLAALADTQGRTLRAVHDGTRIVVAYGDRDRAVGTSSSAIRALEWTQAGGTVTRTLPAWTGGYPLGTSLAVTPVANDMYVVAYGETDDDPKWTTMTRTAGTWSAWATAATADMEGRPGRAHLKAFVQKSSIDFIYLTGTARPWTLYYTKLASTNSPPTAPALLTPATSSILDLNTYGAVFSWEFTDPDPGDTQQAWQFRRKVSGAASYEYLHAGSDTFQATAVWNVGATQEWSFAPGRWANGTHQWSVRTRDSGGLDSPWASDFTVTASASPVVNILSPVAAYTEDSQPVVEWEYVSTNPQRTYQLRVFDLAAFSAVGFSPDTAAPVWDSGEVSSAQARSLRINVSLLNGGTYRVFLRASDSAGLYSSWDEAEFVLLLTPPPAPLIEVAQETAFTTGVPRVRLILRGSTNMLSASQSYDHTTTSQDWESDLNVTLGSASVGGATVAARSLSMTAVATGDMRAISAPGVAPIDTTGAPVPAARDFPAKPLEPYTAVASFTASATPRLCRLSMRFYGPTDQLLLNHVGESTADIVGFPTEISATVVAPLNCDRVRVVLEVLAATEGDVHYVDRIDVHPGRGAGYSPGGLLAAQTYTVLRTDPDGTVTTVRQANAVQGDAHQQLLTFDREMPFGVPVSYSAQAVTLLTSGQPLASNPSPGAVLQVDSAVWALRDPLDVLAEARALVTTHQIEVEELSSVYRPAGRELPLVETEGVQGEDGAAMKLFIDRISEQQNIRGLLRRPATLFLQSPSGRKWYVRFLTRKVAATNGVGQELDLTYVEVAAP